MVVQNQLPNDQRNHKHQANPLVTYKYPSKIQWILLFLTPVLPTQNSIRVQPLRGYYERRQAEDARTAGNGRLARNTLEKAIFNQSRRLVAEPAAELDVILPSDLELQ